MSATLHETYDPNCIFCKIIAGQIPSHKVYEDDELIAFKDIRPIAPVHLLLIPKAHIESLAHVDARHAPLLGRMMVLAQKLALDAGGAPGRDGGFRIVVNNGIEGGQEVMHLHMHIMAGPRPWRIG